jgi:hypothetical protein
LNTTEHLLPKKRDVMTKEARFVREGMRYQYITMTRHKENPRVKPMILRYGCAQERETGERFL